ncbi:MAG: stage II sporulation protein M [Chitinophagaceae bacterium]|nr:stage II sporulation protein M [Chitinophagaceae bacterium]
MREGLFLKKNIEKWKGYQYEPSKEPDEMAQEFTELVNDLGYARTFYPQSKVTQYLNGLASRTYLGIYKNKKEKTSRLISFWTTELPLVIRKHHRELLYSFLIFLSFALIAVFSTLQDQTFVRGVLGDGYVEMTEENISKGDPFGVYKHTDRLTMFFTIALNNIKVSFLCFLGGVLLSLGTIWMLFENGIMLGAFQSFFFLKDLGWSSILVIWIHGTLEISAIIISGGAGFILGNSILFPKTYKRLQSVKRGAKDGMKLMIGLIPVFIAAAFLEGFITRYSTMPKFLSISILVFSLAFIIWYFVIYPIRVAKRHTAG